LVERVRGNDRGTYRNPGRRMGRLRGAEPNISLGPAPRTIEQSEVVFHSQPKFAGGDVQVLFDKRLAEDFSAILI